MKNLLLTFSLLSTLINYSFAQDKITISSFVGVEIGGDIGQYQETVGRSRDATRKMYMDEVVKAAIALSQGTFNPAFFLAPLQKLQETAEQRRDFNKLVDEIGIGFSAGELLKAEIERIYRDNGIAKEERKIEFANQFPKINGRVIYNSRVQFDHYLYMVISHLGGGSFTLTATLGTIGGSRNGIERTFSASGNLIYALKKLAEEIFTAVAGNNRPAWNNPHPHLTWIPGPAGIESLSFQEARAYCAGQNGRLPMSEELILAYHGTNFRQGGINRFKIGEAYYVADQGRQKGSIIIVLMSADGLKVQAQNGFAGKVWCVRGPLSDRSVLIKKLYEIRRKVDPRGISIRYFPQELDKDRLIIIKAVESLLIALGAPDAKLDVTISQADYMDPQEALHLLNNSGFDLTIPKDIENTLE